MQRARGHRSAGFVPFGNLQHVGVRGQRQQLHTSAGKSAVSPGAIGPRATTCSVTPRTRPMPEPDEHVSSSLMFERFSRPCSNSLSLFVRRRL